MKEKARAAGTSEGNCLGCHGANIPVVLNHRGDWLVAEKGRRRAKEFDMAWLKDYKEPVAPKTPAQGRRRHQAGPETVADARR